MQQKICFNPPIIVKALLLCSLTAVMVISLMHSSGLMDSSLEEVLLEERMPSPVPRTGGLKVDIHDAVMVIL